MNSERDFYDLTESGRIRRLRQLAEKVLPRYGMSGAPLKLLTNDFNCIYAVGKREDRRILRIFRPGEHSREQIEAALEWLQILSECSAIILPRPVPTVDGAWVVTEKIEGIPESRYCTMESYIVGSTLGKNATGEDFRQLGRITATMHDVSISETIPHSSYLNVYNNLFPFGDECVLFGENATSRLDPEQQFLFEQASRSIESVISSRFAGKEKSRIIHADLHCYNILRTRNGLAVIDFEDLMWGYPVQDIAITFFYSRHRPDFAEIRREYEKGYRKIRCWPERFPGEIDTFILGRGIDLLNYCLQSKVPEDLEDIDDAIAELLGEVRDFLRRNVKS